MASYSTYIVTGKPSKLIPLPPLRTRPIFHSDFTVGDIVTGPFIPDTAEVVYVGKYGIILHYNGGVNPYSNEYYKNLTIVTPPFKPVILYTLKQKGDK